MTYPHLEVLSNNPNPPIQIRLDDRFKFGDFGSFPAIQSCRNATKNSVVFLNMQISYATDAWCC